MPTISPERLARLQEGAAAARESRVAVVHLYRGAPAVRSWSKYQTTVKGWTLCGIRQGTGKAPATEYSAQVNCPYCLKLMGADIQKALRR